MASSRGRLAGVCAVLGLTLSAQVAQAQDYAFTRTATGPDLSDLSLEELAQVEIISVSRRAEPVAQAAASVFVITAEDIRRSGAPSLPEVLRLAPNLQVQRMNAGEYAITARGFNGFETSNKLLVLVDGRSVYSPLHSGVFWDSRNLMLEDIERIEVISGPGGTLWGANAVNGVINVITRSAAETQGTLASATVGTEDAGFSLRHGGTFGEAGAWRAYVTGFARDDTFNPAGGDATDGLWGVRAGMRADWTAGDAEMTLQGNVWTVDSAEDDDYSGSPIDIRGGHILGRWGRPLGGGELSIQAYADYMERSGDTFVETVATGDLHVQYAHQVGERHQIVLGVGYRAQLSELAAPPGAAFLDPPEETVSLSNIFVQDQIALRPNVILTLGVKLEDSSFSGQEILPSARLAWTRPAGDLIWAAVSRASRTPSRIERGLTLPGFLEPGDFGAESLTAYEIGYRATPLPNVSVSATAFYHMYDDLRTVSLTPVTVTPFYFANGGEGETWGIEAWGAWQVNPRWRLSLGVQTLEKDLALSPGETDISGFASQGQDPDYQVLLRSQADITDRLEFDASLRAVGDLITVESYVDLDMRIGWAVTDQVELSISGRDLLSDERVETYDSRRRAFGRSVLATLTARF